jgi:hypothetical protein
MNSGEYRIVKSINSRRYEIELFERPDGYYEVCYVSEHMSGKSDPIKDLGNAMHLFDVKLQELEGM